MYTIPPDFGQSLNQEQAAAFAVLAANVRKDLEEQFPPDASDEKAVLAHRALCAFLQEIEAQSTASLAKNDGNVVHWVGVAAKQMNPLLS